jgi:hypothetical protein
MHLHADQGKIVSQQRPRCVARSMGSIGAAANTRCPKQHPAGSSIFIGRRPSCGLPSSAGRLRARCANTAAMARRYVDETDHGGVLDICKNICERGRRCALQNWSSNLAAGLRLEFFPASADGGSDYIPRVIKELAEDESVLALVLPEAGSDSHQLSGLGEPGHERLPCCNAATGGAITGRPVAQGTPDLSGSCPCVQPTRRGCKPARSVWPAAGRLLLLVWSARLRGCQGQRAGHAADGKAPRWLPHPRDACGSQCHRPASRSWPSMAGAAGMCAGSSQGAVMPGRCPQRQHALLALQHAYVPGVPPLADAPPRRVRCALGMARPAPART